MDNGASGLGLGFLHMQSQAADTETRLGAPTRGWLPLPEEIALLATSAKDSGATQSRPRMTDVAQSPWSTALEQQGKGFQGCWLFRAVNQRGCQHTTHYVVLCIRPGAAVAVFGGSQHKFHTLFNVKFKFLKAHRSPPPLYLSNQQTGTALLWSAFTTED